MRYVIIDNGVVSNVIEATEDFATSIGAVQSDSAEIGDIYSNGVFSKAPPKMPSLADYDAALVAHLDAEARTHNYADRISAAVRAGYPGPFQQEGIAFATWMDTCNAIGYQMLADFQAGNIPQPTVQEVLDALPEMVWPT
jgi:hypothetical protein